MTANVNGIVDHEALISLDLVDLCDGGTITIGPDIVPAIIDYPIMTPSSPLTITLDVARISPDMSFTNCP